LWFLVGSEMLAYLVGQIVFERARMRPLVPDPKLRQVLEDQLALYLELSRQLVNSNLGHPEASSLL